MAVTLWGLRFIGVLGVQVLDVYTLKVQGTTYGRKVLGNSMVVLSLNLEP